MRAERFGIVLDGDDRGPDVVLVALEVDDAVHLLVAAAAEARADDALVVAAALLRLCGSSSDFSGFFLRSVISAKSLTEPCRRPGVIGLYWRMPMVHLSAA